jgi:hypothetical protein
VPLGSGFDVLDVRGVDEEVRVDPGLTAFAEAQEAVARMTNNPGVMRIC